MEERETTMNRRSGGKVNWKLQLFLAGVIFLIFSVYIPILSYMGVDFRKGILTMETIHLSVSILLALACAFLIRGEVAGQSARGLSGRTKGLLVVLFVVFLGIAVLIGVFSNWAAVLRLDSISILKCLFIAVSAAVFEELLVRGLILSALIQAFQNRRCRFLAAGLLSGLIFGGLHYFNLLQNASLAQTNQQVFYAAALGMAFAAFRICFRNLWFPILLHFAIDFQPSIGESQQGEGGSWVALIILFLPIGLIAASTLLSVDKDENFQRMKEQEAE